MTQNTASEPQYSSLTEVAQRLYWFFIGPMFLILMLLLILSGDKSRVFGCTVAYIVGLVLLPLVRWREMLSGKAQTTDGKPATWENFRNYTLTVLGVGIAAIVAANLWVHFTQ
jgi:hypothetical protein